MNNQSSSYSQSAAQGVERAPLQRTIEEIDPHTNKPVGETTLEQATQQQASSSVIYGLGGIILLLIAIGVAIYLMKSEKNSSKKPRKSTPKFL